MKFKILKIYEEDYGCEGVPDDEEPMLSVLVRDEKGGEKWFRLSDSFLSSRNLDVGSILETDE